MSKGTKPRNPKYGPLAQDVLRHAAGRQEALIAVKHVDNPAIVTVFGAGIAGLTAAHELAMRGCLVQVVEAKRDAYARGRPQVGGMAATQYARIRADVEDLHPELLKPWPGDKEKVRQWLVRLFAYNRSWWIQTEQPLKIHGALYSGPRDGDEPNFGDKIAKQLSDLRKQYRKRWIWDLMMRGPIIGQVEGVGEADATRTAKGLYDRWVDERVSAFHLARNVHGLVRRWPERVSSTLLAANRREIAAAIEREFLSFRLIAYAQEGVKGAPEHARQLLKQWQRFFQRTRLRDNLRAVSDDAAQVWIVDKPSWGKDWWLEVEVVEQRLPGEHGFRFFPSYYRHLDDTMKRIPLCPGACGSETAYDNLRPSKLQAIGLSRADREDFPEPARHDVGPVEVKRDRPVSFEGLRDRSDRLFARLGCTPRDTALFCARLLRFATSSPARRHEEYEKMSWADFVGITDGDRKLPKLPYSEPMKALIGASAQCLLALSAAEADARTYGDATMQLLMDAHTDGSRTDRTLNGPTSDAWLEPWREHLERIGVRFFLGTLEGLERDDDGEIVPRFRDWRRMRKISEDGHRLLTHREREKGQRPDFYVMALDLGGAADLTAGFAGRDAASDFADLQTFAREVRARNGLKDMTGVQFFFEAKTSLGKEGHMLFPYSKWGLSSISQSEYWSERAGFSDVSRGVLSVDVSDAAQAAGVHSVRVVERNGQRAVQHAESAPALTVAEALQGSLAQEDGEASDDGGFQMARRVWDQLKGRIGHADRLPEPQVFHVDENIRVENGELKNATRYLAALPETWGLRPGLENGKIKYRINHKRWVLCGTFMATHTRMSTMEAANESGRHAAIAILEQLQPLPQVGSEHDYFAAADGQMFAIHSGENDTYNHASSYRHFDLPDIFNPEEFEAEDLEFFRSLDAKLFDAKLPHWMHICDFDQRISLLLQLIELDAQLGVNRANENIEKWDGWVKFHVEAITAGLRQALGRDHQINEGQILNILRVLRPFVVRPQG